MGPGNALTQTLFRFLGLFPVLFVNFRITTCLSETADVPDQNDVDADMCVVML